MVFIYAFHATDAAGFRGIGDGDWSRGGFVGGGGLANFNNGWFNLSSGGKLGRGVYASTSYEKARRYGEYVYLIQFEVNRLRLVNRWDPESHWRKIQAADGAYAHAFLQGDDTELDEFCMRGRSLRTVWLIRKPGDHSVGIAYADNFHFRDPWVARGALNHAIAGGAGRQLPGTIAVTQRMLDGARRHL